MVAYFEAFPFELLKRRDVERIAVAIILVLAPVFLPILRLYGIDPVYFGILLTINLAIGANTPPLGIDLMAACRVGGIPMSRAFGYLMPFLGVMTAVLVFLVFVPWIVTDLPHLIF